MDFGPVSFGIYMRILRIICGGKQRGKVTDMIAPLAYRKAKSHDSGFIMMCSLGNGYRLTGKPEYKEGLLHAADSLAMLYNPVVGTILSWPGMVKKKTGRTILLLTI